MSEDRLLVAVSRDGRLRARAARTTGLVNEALRRHTPGPLGSLALGRALSVMAVFPATWKDCERVSVQWSGGGCLKTVMAEARPGGVLRGYVRHPSAGAPMPREGYRGVAHGLLPGGFVGVIRQSIRGTFQQGQVELTSGELDEDLEVFFEQSDQVATRLRGLVGMGSSTEQLTECAGVMIQELPDDQPTSLPAGAVLEALDPAASLADLLAAAMGQPFDVLEEIPLRFACSCDRERVAAGIGLLSVDELLDMINDDKGASIHCEFCAEDYRFNREDLEEIMVRKVTDKGDG